MDLVVFGCNNKNKTKDMTIKTSLKFQFFFINIGHCYHGLCISMALYNVFKIFVLMTLQRKWHKNLQKVTFLLIVFIVLFKILMAHTKIPH